MRVVFGISLSVTACLRGGTRVDVAWNLDPDKVPRFDANDAVAVTPGGGRLGSLLGGALDGRLIELALGDPTEARVVPCELDAIEAASLGIEPGTVIRLVFAPAVVLPETIWAPLLERTPVAIAAELEGDRLRRIRVDDPATTTAFRLTDEALTCSWSPTTSLVLFGGGPMADALGRAAEFVGWSVERTTGAEQAVGLAAMMSPIDGLVVMGHDTESVGRVLEAALASRVGYIGSIGPDSLQRDRGDWLAYRGVTDTSRIHGPAGFPIGAVTPGEVALSVVCEMVSVRSAAVD